MVDRNVSSIYISYVFGWVWTLYEWWSFGGDV